MVPLYFVYSGPPPADNVLARNLVTVGGGSRSSSSSLPACGGLFAGRAGLAGDIATAFAGAAARVVTLVAASLETGVALRVPDGSKDPTIDGPLANGMVLLHGPGRSMPRRCAPDLGGVAVRRRAALPSWSAPARSCSPWSTWPSCRPCSSAWIPGLLRRERLGEHRQHRAGQHALGRRRRRCPVPRWQPCRPAREEGRQRDEKRLEWEGIVEKKSRGTGSTESNMYRRLEVRLVDGSTTGVRVKRAAGGPITEGDLVSKSHGQDR